MGAGFVKKIFGGRERVEQLRQHLHLVRSAGARAVVCTRGLTGAVKKCLKDVDLLHLFEDVYGNSDDCYIAGQTAFDAYIKREPPTQEDEELCVSGAGYDSKNEVIQSVVSKLGVSAGEAILVDDDPMEISRAATLCNTL